jgi:hypothetical protein
MEWTTQQQTLFDELRSRELAGTLTVQEQTQLAGLIQILEAEEARYLAPATDQMRAEQAALRERLQEQLVADARHWLTQFEQRHQQIQQTYTRLTGEILTATVSP